jgi:hypothetical protein
MAFMDAVKYSVRMTTTTTANTPPPIASATCQTPPASSLTLSGLETNSTIAPDTYS